MECAGKRSGDGALFHCAALTNSKARRTSFAAALHMAYRLTGAPHPHARAGLTLLYDYSFDFNPAHVK